MFVRNSEKKKQHKHKLLSPVFSPTFLTLTPGCRGVKKFLPTGAAGKRSFSNFGADIHDFRRGRPSAEGLSKKFGQKEVCVDFFGP